MKKLSLIFLILLVCSCESNDNKNSRLTIDKYSRKLSSILETVVNSRVEEGNQSQLTLSNFYTRYTSQIESYINDLNFETISPKYSLYRNELLQNAKTINFYLNSRRNAVNSLSDTFSAYDSGKRNKDDYKEYRSEMYSSEYSFDMYRKMTISSLEDYRNELINFYSAAGSLKNELHLMDSVYFELDSAFVKYNTMKDKSKLIERLIMPINFRDTVNDWVLKAQNTIENISFPSLDEQLLN